MMRNTKSGCLKAFALAGSALAATLSPHGGQIAYAGEFSDFGQALIIDAGGGYHSLLAGKSWIKAQPGQFVAAGETVGNMSGTGIFSSLAARTEFPILYGELHKDGWPIDPGPLWVSGQQKVQG